MAESPLEPQVRFICRGTTAPTTAVRPLAARAGEDVIRETVGTLHAAREHTPWRARAWKPFPTRGPHVGRHARPRRVVAARDKTW